MPWLPDPKAVIAEEQVVCKGLLPYLRTPPHPPPPPPTHLQAVVAVEQVVCVSPGVVQHLVGERAHAPVCQLEALVGLPQKATWGGVGWEQSVGRGLPFGQLDALVGLPQRLWGGVEASVSVHRDAGLLIRAPFCNPPPTLKTQEQNRTHQV